MKVTKEQALRNKEALLEAAGRLFKERGIDGTGVADVCREAGLTHGALYKHFEGKEDLVAQAFEHAFRATYQRLVEVGGSGPPLKFFVDRYLSPEVRDDLSRGCPLVATACETARQGEGVSSSFTTAFRDLHGAVEAALPASASGIDRSAFGTLAVAAFVGAMAISRGVAKADGSLSDRVLSDVRKVLDELAAK